MKKIELKPNEAQGILEDLKKILKVKGHKLSFSVNLIIAAIVKEFEINQKAFAESRNEYFIQDESGQPKLFNDEEGNQIHKLQEEKIEDFQKLTQEYLETPFEVTIRPIPIDKFNEELDHERFADVELVSLFINYELITE